MSEQAWGELVVSSRAAARALTALRWLVVAGGLLPLLARALLLVPALAPLGEGLYALYGLQCHQEPARSLQLWGRALPVCVRCLGLYVGMSAGAALGWPRLPLRLLRAALVMVLALLLLDVMTEWVGLRPTSALLRGLTGLLAGSVLGLLLALRPKAERPAGPPKLR